MFENALKLQTPLTKQVTKNLKAGQWVLLSGEIYTGRDQAHRRMFETMDKGEKLPVEIPGIIIYYCGPTPPRPGRVIGSAGPTTSSRMDKFAPKLYDMGMAASIGKGERSAEVKEAIKRNGAVFLVCVGGAGAYLAERIKAAELVAWPDLGPEAIYKLTVEDFPCVVAYDAQGGDFFENCRNKISEECR